MGSRATILHRPPSSSSKSNTTGSGNHVTSSRGRLSSDIAARTAMDPTDRFFEEIFVHDCVGLPGDRSAHSHKMKRPSNSALIVAGSALAALFSILQVSGCSFMSSSAVDGAEPGSSELGLYTYMSYGEDGEKLGCLNYSGQMEIDGMLKAARAFGVITAMWSTTAFVLVVATICLLPKWHRIWYSLARALLVTATVTQLFTFFALGSQHCLSNSCKISALGVLGIFNLFLLATLSVAIVLLPSPRSPLFVIWNEEEVTANKTSLAVGQGRGIEFSNSHDKGPMLEMEADDEVYQSSGASTTSHVLSEGETVHSNHHSVQESLVSTFGPLYKPLFRISVYSLVVFSWILSVVSVRHCTFVLVGFVEDNRDSDLGIGLYSRAAYLDDEIIGCLSYPEDARDTFDPPFQVARVFGVVATLLMTVVLLLFTLQLFVQIAKEEIWFAVRCLLTCTLISQLLTFVVFKAEVCSFSDSAQCVPGAAGALAIVNIFCMLGLTMLSYISPPPPNALFLRWRGDGSTEPMKSVHDAFVEQQLQLSESPEYRSDEQTISIQIVYEYGEKKTIKEITHPDGSKTITTTIEELDEDEEDEGGEDSDEEIDASSRDDTTVDKSEVMEDIPMLDELKVEDEEDEDEILAPYMSNVTYLPPHAAVTDIIPPHLRANELSESTTLSENYNLPPHLRQIPEDSEDHFNDVPLATIDEEQTVVSELDETSVVSRHRPGAAQRRTQELRQSKK